jgi:hypothetical protein
MRTRLQCNFIMIVSLRPVGVRGCTETDCGMKDAAVNEEFGVVVSPNLINAP